MIDKGKDSVGMIGVKVRAEVVVMIVGIGIGNREGIEDDFE